MTDLPRNEPSFDDEEVALILTRAAELQQQEPDAERRGFTLTELERIAQEAGIESSFLRRAAAELQRKGKPPGQAGYEEETKTITLERTVRKDVPDAELEVLAETVRQALDRRGQTRRLNRDLVWSADSSNLAERALESFTKPTRKVGVTLARREGQTRIRVEEQLQSQATEYLLLSMCVTGALCSTLIMMAVAAKLGPALALSLAASAVLMTGSFVLSRRLFRALVRRRSRELQQLVERLTEQIAEIPERRKELPAQSSQPEPPE